MNRRRVPAVERYRIEAWRDGTWSQVSRGTTIGQRKLDRWDGVTTDRIRLVIESSLGSPRIGSIGLYAGES